MFIYLTEDDLVVIHQSFLDQPALRDPALLSAAVARPRASGHYEHADMATQVAVLIEAVAQAHAFIDTNKRTATAAGLIFSQLNGYRCRYTGDSAHDELGTMVVSLVVHQVSQEDVADWLRNRLVQSATPQPFEAVLLQVLHDFAPTFQFLQDK